MTPVTWAASAAAFLVGVILFIPLSCWEALCVADAPDCRSSGCENLLGMTFDSKAVWIGVLGGVALAAVVFVTSSAVRSSVLSRRAAR